MLKDVTEMSELAFVEKYMAMIVKINKRFDTKEFSTEDRDDYYEAYNNQIVNVLTIINPEHEFYPDDESRYL